VHVKRDSRLLLAKSATNPATADHHCTSGCALDLVRFVAHVQLQGIHCSFICDHARSHRRPEAVLITGAPPAAAGPSRKVLVHLAALLVIEGVISERIRDGAFTPLCCCSLFLLGSSGCPCHSHKMQTIQMRYHCCGPALPVNISVHGTHEHVVCRSASARTASRAGEACLQMVSVCIASRNAR
jgi:hypothetical protein